jgi:phthalate 4,5-dioxygenase oxygenase subunit
MLSREDNELVTNTNRGTPTGDLFRRFWLPVALSEEVAARDGTPVRVKALGEDLVAFRDTDGQVGLVDAYCPHRGAPLFFGRNEECGLRCLYHGWKFDVEGNIVDMSSEPDGAALKKSLQHKAYPAREAGGFVWIWMGPRDAMREFEPPAWAPHPGCRTSIVKMHAACNWAQVLEGSIDSAHSSSLHSTEMPAAQVDSAKAAGKVWPRPSNDKAPRLQFQATGYGFRYAAIRRPILNPETNQYVRTTLFIAPFTVLIPPNDQYRLAQMLVPVDDVNTMFYWIAWHPEPDKGISQEEWR